MLNLKNKDSKSSYLKSKVQTKDSSMQLRQKDKK